MAWIEKGQSTSFEHEPIEGLYFIDGDAVAALIKPDWTKGEKFPKIAFPSGQDFEIWEGSGSPIIHIYGEMDLRLKDTRDAAYQYANYVAEQCGYLVAPVGDNQLEVIGTDDEEHFLLTYDSERGVIADIEAVEDKNPSPLFPMGLIMATPGAIKSMEEAGQDRTELLMRHVTGDWGDLGEEDKQENDFSVDKSLRIFSAYNLESGEKVYIITEADRSSTTILRPEEY